MPYSFQDRLNHTGQRIKQINSEFVTLVRGIDTTPAVAASPILMEAEEMMPGVAITRFEYQDWAFDTADYQFNGVVSKPHVGDVITRTDGSRFRVISFGNNEPAYRYMTTARKRIRVHSEQVS